MSEEEGNHTTGRLHMARAAYEEGYEHWDVEVSAVGDKVAVGLSIPGVSMVQVFDLRSAEELEKAIRDAVRIARNEDPTTRLNLLGERLAGESMPDRALEIVNEINRIAEPMKPAGNAERRGEGMGCEMRMVCDFCDGVVRDTDASYMVMGPWGRAELDERYVLCPACKELLNDRMSELRR